MNHLTRYILQFVGFKTLLDEKEIIRRWTPFASNFKSQGIATIDLYRVVNGNDLTFISRNIWEEKKYFESFPTGMAGSGSGGGISVTQFGGYFIQANQLERQDEMHLLFLHDTHHIEDDTTFTCERATGHVPYPQVSISQTSHANTSKAMLCQHLTHM